MRFLLLLLLLLAGQPSPPLLAQVPILLAEARKLAGQDSNARRFTIAHALRQAGLKVEVEEYVRRNLRGKNLLVRFGNTGAPLIVAAHLDHLLSSPGANDNASGCALLLSLARKLAAHAPKSPLLLLFVDGGKQGHLGTRDFLERRSGKPQRGVINLDLVGQGDTLLLGPLAPLHDNPLLSLAFKALQGVGEGFKRPLAATPPTETRIFLQHDIPALTLMVFPRLEISALESFMKSRGRGGLKPPPTLARILSSQDNAAGLDGRALLLAEKGLQQVVGAEQARPLRLFPVRLHWKRELKRLQALVADGSLWSTHSLDERLGIFRRVGARGLFKAALGVLRRGRAEGLRGVANLLGSTLAGHALRQEAAAVWRAKNSQQALAALETIYRRHWARLELDPKRGLVRLGTSSSPPPP